MKETGVKKKKKWPIVLLIILVIIGLLCGTIAVNASANKKVMDRTVKSGMDTLSSMAEVTAVDAGEYEEITMYGVMKFHVSQYDVKDIGNLSVMTTNMGFMQMVSYVITPYKKNMPMLSMDFMYIMGNRKAYAEFYDLVADPADPEYQSVLDNIRKFEQEYSGLEDIEAESAWYDDLRTVAMHKAVDKDDDAKMEQMFCDAVRCYMATAKDLELLSDEERTEKLEITQEYCDNLVEKGGVSTDVFKKALGEEKAKDFFNKVFFGTEKYRVE